MILYDEKLNFLGMSEHTLMFLGYEDLADFTSMQSDVADLFVKKEGYIYKFDNFSWIDFVLYGGSSKRSAIIKLKNGEETPIDLAIKEIFLQNSMEGNKKLFSVKLISNNFHKISGVPRENRSVDKKDNKFSLNNLIGKENVAITPTIDDADDKGFILQEQKNSIPTQEQQNIQSSDNVPLNFLNVEDSNDIKESEPKQESETNTEELNFLKIKDDKPEVEYFQDNQIEGKKEMDNNLSLNLLKEQTQVNKYSEQIDKDLNFLTNQDEKIEKEDVIDFNTQLSFLTKKTESLDNKQEDEKHEIDDNPLLNFLKVDDSKKEEVKSHEEDSSSIDFKLNFLKKDADDSDQNMKNIQKDKSKIIKQIKKDIIEIDKPVNQPMQTLDPKTSELPATSIEKEETSTDENRIKVFEEDQSSNNNSFENTLNSLFDTKQSKHLDNDILDDSREKVFSFKLKQRNDRIDEDIKTIKNKQNSSKIDSTISSIKSFGLNPDQENDLLSDFIEDAKQNLNSINHFIEIEDFDKIKYSLVKIKSSAEILSLDDIISIANTMKGNCDERSVQKILDNLMDLSGQIEQLAQHVLRTAV